MSHPSTKSTKPETPNPGQTQFDRFRETARALDADEDSGRFDVQLTKIAAHKPEPKPALKKKRPSKKPGRSR
jgi:hypothetical protein